MPNALYSDPTAGGFDVNAPRPAATREEMRRAAIRNMERRVAALQAQSEVLPSSGTVGPSGSSSISPVAPGSGAPRAPSIAAVGDFHNIAPPAAPQHPGMGPQAEQGGGGEIFDSVKPLLDIGSKIYKQMGSGAGGAPALPDLGEFSIGGGGFGGMGGGTTGAIDVGGGFSAGGGGMGTPFEMFGAGDMGLGEFTAGGGGLGGGGAGAGGGASGGLGGMGPLLYAYLIGKGKMLENENPDSALGKGLLAGLGPSFAQVREDPMGMGLPTALGLPFLTPFTGSKKARATEPEWAGLWNMFGLG